MKPLPRLLPLVFSQPCPVGAPGLSRRDSTCPSGHAMQDRPIEVLVEDVVVGGHRPQPLSFHPRNLIGRATADYRAKIEVSQCPAL